MTSRINTRKVHKSVHTGTGFLLLCLSVCLLPAVFKKTSFGRNRIKTSRSTPGREERRRDFNGKSCKDAEPTKKEENLLLCQTLYLVYVPLGLQFPSSLKRCFVRVLPAPIACYEKLHVQRACLFCKTWLQMFACESWNSRNCELCTVESTFCRRR